MEERPLVSVIIPTYNRISYLKLTLDSVVSQTYRPMEIIVVDDGSSGTKNELVCLQYDNLRYIKIKNSGGPAKPRNVGIKNAVGTFIAFVDDDDLWMPQKLEKQVKILKTNLDFDLVHGPCQIINEKGEHTNKTIGRPGSLEVKHGDVSGRMTGNWTLMTPTPLLRTSLLQKVGLFNEKMPSAGEDTEFWTRCSFHGKFYYLDEPLVWYRKHASNISNHNKDYVMAPFFLFKMITEKYEHGIIDKHKFKKLRRNIVNLQIKRMELGKSRALNNLWKIKPFWYFDIRHLRLFLKEEFTNK